jgi:hypothetical protein
MRCRPFIRAGAFLFFACVQLLQAAKAFDGYQISDVASFENLDVRFIRGVESGGMSPITLQEAMATGGAAVYTVGDSIYVQNVSASPVFVELGTLLKGGMQDQVVARTLILPPRSSRVQLDTFCVDPFRSSERQGEDVNVYSVSGALFPWHVARVGMLAGASEIEAAKGLRGLQVWWSIDTLRDRLSRRLGVPLEPPTPAHWKLSDDDRTDKLLVARRSEWKTALPLALENRRLTAAMRGYEKKLTPAATGSRNINGAVFAINGRIVGAEIYRSPRLFQQMWPHLLRAFAIEALASGQAGKFKPPAADTVTEFLRSSEVGPARTAVNYPVPSPQGDKEFSSLLNELGKAETLTSDRVVELLHHLDVTPTFLIKSLVRDSQAAIFVETSGTDGQWVNRSFVSKPDRAAGRSAPEELIISGIEAGQIEGHAFESFGSDTLVIARPVQDNWSLTVEGIRPAVASPAPALLSPPQFTRTSRLAFFALPGIAVATLLGLVFVRRRRSGCASIAASVAKVPVAGPAPEVMQDAVPSLAPVLPPALPEARPERPMPHLVAVADVEEPKEAPPRRARLEIERLAA